VRGISRPKEARLVEQVRQMELILEGLINLRGSGIAQPIMLAACYSCFTILLFQCYYLFYSSAKGTLILLRELLVFRKVTGLLNFL
jgi:hypothetical protein